MPSVRVVKVENFSCIVTSLVNKIHLEQQRFFLLIIAIDMLMHFKCINELRFMNHKLKKFFKHVAICLPNFKIMLFFEKKSFLLIKHFLPSSNYFIS